MSMPMTAVRGHIGKFAISAKYLMIVLDIVKNEQNAHNYKAVLGNLSEY